MRVGQIAFFLPHGADDARRSLLGREKGGKALVHKKSEKLFADGVLSLAAKSAHPFAHPLSILRGKIEKPLEIGGYKNIHRGGHRAQERPVFIVYARAQEVRQHVVAVRGAQQLSDRETGALGEVSGENIAEVAGRHGEVHTLARSDGARAQELGIGGKVIRDLRRETAPVDGVRA